MNTSRGLLLLDIRIEGLFMNKFFASRVLLTFVLLFTFDVWAKQNTDRNKLVGNIIKNALESYHYLGLKVDDSVSQKAFKEYLKRVDFGKQMLLKSDIKELEAYQAQMDDEIVSGDVLLVDRSMQMVRDRITKLDSWRTEFFKTKFDFEQKEYIEVDPEKRDFFASEADLKNHWHKIFKQAVLMRYLDLDEEQSDDPLSPMNKKNKTKKKVKKKKMTDAELWKEAYEAIDKKYKIYFERMLKEVADDYLEKFYNSIAHIYDPHTVYLPPKKKEDFDIDISGSLEGIGAVLQEDGAYIKVVSIVPGGAAWREKELEVEDIILSVGQGDKEQVSLVDMRVDDAVRYIRGPKGTEVKLTVKKVDGTRKVIKIVRDVVQIGASFAKSSILQVKNMGVRVGYIHLPKFYRDFDENARTCSDDVKKEIEGLKKKKVDAIILDLRNNGGGALEDARIMSGFFIDKGPIVQIRNQRGGTEILKDGDPEITYDGPLIVMTNRFSASASEIVAGALQDYGRAVIVGGEFSHGKGTVQAVVNLNQTPLLSMFGPTMGALKVTIQKFYRVTGASTQYKGITPDIVVPDPFGYAESREQDLDFSLKWDQVEKQTFAPWNKGKFDMEMLKKRSSMRVAASPRMKKIVESVEYLTKKRKETLVPISLTEVKAKDEENQQMTKKLKLEEVNENILLAEYEESLKSSEGNAIDMKDPKWKKDFEQRKEEWVKQLRQDPGLEEAIYVADDMVSMTKGQTLGLNK
ncbi:MAG TPA: tail-specific protease [Bdellovibrionales bacterium]|nr:tail-specific protease [Bdellovibrionales bacterium]